MSRALPHPLTLPPQQPPLRVAKLGRLVTLRPSIRLAGISLIPPRSIGNHRDIDLASEAGLSEPRVAGSSPAGCVHKSPALEPETQGWRVGQSSRSSLSSARRSQN